MRLVISETATSTWHYHLREVKNGRLYLGGAAPNAICGAKLGWDTQIPLSTWGQESSHPAHWCERCHLRMQPESLAQHDKEANRG